MRATENNKTLDVREIEPKLKHPTIFNAFDNLTEGEVLTIINDHDPLPLYYQLKAERQSSFTWNYVAEGPKVWEVDIQNLKDANGITVGEMVRDNPRAASIFKKYKIDYCCQGKRHFEEACRIAGVEPKKLLDEIDSLAKQPNAHLRVQDWPLEMLIDYIINNHHLYVRKSGTDIKGLVDKVAKVHGDTQPELLLVSQYFFDLMEELNSHMQREEQVLFPAIKKLTKEYEAKKQVKLGSIKNAIDMMEAEHEEAGTLLEKIREKTNEFELPEGACTSYRLLFSMMQEFEDDLHQHIHLENNVLFPRAIVVEEQLVK